MYVFFIFFTSPSWWFRVMVLNRVFRLYFPPPENKTDNLNWSAKHYLKPFDMIKLKWYSQKLKCNFHKLNAIDGFRLFDSFPFHMLNWLLSIINLAIKIQFLLLYEFMSQSENHQRHMAGMFRHWFHFQKLPFIYGVDHHIQILKKSL